MQTKLDYISGSSVIPKGSVGISPSQLHKFFDKPHEWYRENVLGEEGFTGSTASYLGTIVHFIAEDFANRRKVDKAEIHRYLYKELVSDKSIPLEDFEDEEISELYLQELADNPDVDIFTILDQYKPMGNCLIQNLRLDMPDETEQLISAEVLPGYFACGSCDARKGDMVIDYKTTSDKTPKSYIPYAYKLQLLTYAWIYRQNGTQINRIQIKWTTREEIGRVSEKTGKPMKDYPAQTATVEEVVTEEDYEFIESLLKLVAESMMASDKYPELRHIIWKDYRLKQV